MTHSFTSILSKHKVPHLDIGNQTGRTDYLDFIKQGQVIYPIMRGQDIFRRSFFVIRVKGEFDDGTTEHYMQTFFQRYTNESLWMGCGHYGKHFLEPCGGVTKNQAKLLMALMQGEAITFDCTNNNYRIPYGGKISKYRGNITLTLANESDLKAQ